MDSLLHDNWNGMTALLIKKFLLENIFSYFAKFKKKIASLIGVDSEINPINPNSSVYA